MPIFQLTDELVMPRPELASPEGLLAVGGDLRAERLVLAYSYGIFPWYGEGEEILWWSPDPRCIFEPGGMHVSRRLARERRRPAWDLRIDTSFVTVLEHCATVPRPGTTGTWLTAEMRRAYAELHRLGLAHSVEAWYEGELAGGVYGVSLGKAFFGESMFSLRANASKVALAFLLDRLEEHGFELMDCQVDSPHLRRLGARLLPRAQFLARLRRAVARPEPRALWPRPGRAGRTRGHG